MSDVFINKKCNICNKKKSMVMKCSKCDLLFCISHLNIESHSCKNIVKEKMIMTEKIIPLKIDKI